MLLKSDTSVRTTSLKVKLTFILCFDSNRNVFYLHMVTSVACNSTSCHAHVWLYKGCGYNVDLSVPCTSTSDLVTVILVVWLIGCINLRSMHVLM